MGGGRVARSRESSCGSATQEKSTVGLRRNKRQRFASIIEVHCDRSDCLYCEDEQSWSGITVAHGNQSSEKCVQKLVRGSGNVFSVDTICRTILRTITRRSQGLCRQRTHSRARDASEKHRETMQIQII